MIKKNSLTDKTTTILAICLVLGMAALIVKGFSLLTGAPFTLLWACAMTWIVVAAMYQKHHGGSK